MLLLMHRDWLDWILDRKLETNLIINEWWLMSISIWQGHIYCFPLLFCRYLIVRNVPSLGCRKELKKLFESYGPVKEWVILFITPDCSVLKFFIFFLLLSLNFIEAYSTTKSSNVSVSLKPEQTVINSIRDRVLPNAQQISDKVIFFPYFC